MSNSTSKTHIATIGAPFGVRGCFRIKTLTEDPKSVLSYGPLTDPKGKAYTFTLVRVEDENTLVVSEKNTPDRTAAELLRGIKLYTETSNLPIVDENDDAYYYHALLDLTVKDTDNNIIGTVVSVENYGASDILVIETDEGEKQIAFTLDSVIDVNLIEKYIVVVKEHVM